jgi:MarR family transcriptional regulator, organic hydroperoxide resistance regulator
MVSAEPTSIVQAVDALRRIIRKLRVAEKRTHTNTGLSAAQLFVLGALADGQPASVSELAERTLTDRSSVAAVVERLAERRLVSRRKSGADRRRAAVTITSAGRAVLRRSSEPPTVILISALRSLPPASCTALARGLGALETALGISGQHAGMLFDDTGRAPKQRATRTPAHGGGRRSGERKRLARR